MLKKLKFLEKKEDNLDKVFVALANHNVYLLSDLVVPNHLDFEGFVYYTL